MSAVYAMRKALANMKYELELEQVELEFCIASYDWADKELVVAKRKADIALHEFRVQELAKRIETARLN